VEALEKRIELLKEVSALVNSAEEAAKAYKKAADPLTQDDDMSLEQIASVCSVAEQAAEEAQLRGRQCHDFIKMNADAMKPLPKQGMVISADDKAAGPEVEEVNLVNVMKRLNDANFTREGIVKAAWSGKVKATKKAEAKKEDGRNQ